MRFAAGGDGSTHGRVGIPYPDLDLVEPLVHAQRVIDAFQAVAGRFEGGHLGREAEFTVVGDPSDDLERNNEQTKQPSRSQTSTC